LAHAENNTTIFHKSAKPGGGLVYRGILSEREMKEGSGNGASLSLSLSLSVWELWEEKLVEFFIFWGP